MKTFIASGHHADRDVVAAAVSNLGHDDGMATMPSLLLQNTAHGKALLLELRDEFNQICSRQDPSCCKTCGEKGCRDKLAQLLIHFLNLFTEVARNERKLIGHYRIKPEYRKTLDEHLFAHDKIINDISSYVMDCDRAPMDTVIHAALSTLAYWTDGHIPTHDKLLLDIVSGTTASS